jgi:hypothetical protein
LRGFAEREMNAHSCRRFGGICNVADVTARRSKGCRKIAAAFFGAICTILPKRFNRGLSPIFSYFDLYN